MTFSWLSRPPPLMTSARALFTSLSLKVPFQGFPVCLTTHKAARASSALWGWVGGGSRWQASRNREGEGQRSATPHPREAVWRPLCSSSLGFPCPGSFSPSRVCNTPLLSGIPHGSNLVRSLCPETDPDTTTSIAPLTPTTF